MSPDDSRANAGRNGPTGRSSHEKALDCRNPAECGMPLVSPDP
jgi:hypothetical protein